MSYKNIFYQREKNLIHLWDQHRGYTSFPYNRYAYQKSLKGEFQSIYGDKLTKVYKYTKDDLDLFESDVPEVTRTLIDLYSDTDEVSDGHVVLTFDIEVEMNTGLPDTEKAENTITAVALHDSITNDYFAYVLSDSVEIDKYIERKNAYVKSFNDEKSLLISVLNKWQEIDPTIITGWNIDFFDTTYFYNRLVRLFDKKTANLISPIGVVEWNKFRKRYMIAGVSSLDYMALFKNFTYSEYPNYRLDTICKLELGYGKIEYDGNLDQLFRDDLEKFIEYNLVDVELVVALDKKLQFIDLARAVTHAGHVAYEDFLFSSKWLEGAILTFLRRNNKVAPNKPKYAKINDDDEKFEGAYVKMPIPGVYHWIYDLDLTSLYPSIIMTINISPETKRGEVLNFTTDNYMKNQIDNYTIVDLHGDTYEIGDKEKFTKYIIDMNYSVAANGALYTKDQVGVIPEILDVWFSKRVEYKNLMKKFGKGGDDNKYKFYFRRQLVQKIMLNSLYGVLGLRNFRFYDVLNAEAVTITGQVVIKTTELISNQYYNTKIGGIYELELEDGKIIEIGGNTVVKLLDGTEKKVVDLVDNDDIII